MNRFHFKGRPTLDAKWVPVFWLFIHSLFPPCGDTCNNKHQNIMTSMSFYIHNVRKRDREKNLI